MLLFAIAAHATPPIAVQLGTSTTPAIVRLSAMQQVGPAASGGCCGQSTPVAQFTLFWAPYDMEAEALCFVVPSGTSTRPHGLALLDVGPDGRPGNLLFSSDDIYVSGGGTYCATLTDAAGTVVDPVAIVNDRLALAKDEPVWLGFYAGNGIGSISYHVLNSGTAEGLGQPNPGSQVVRHLQQNSFTGWVSFPATFDVANGQPVTVSVQRAP